MLITFFRPESSLRGTSGQVRKTLAKKSYTTPSDFGRFIYDLFTRNYLCFLFFPHSLFSSLARWSFHMLQPSLFQCVSSFPWYNWRSWFLKQNAEFWRQLKGLCHVSIITLMFIENRALWLARSFASSSYNHCGVIIASEGKQFLKMAARFVAVSESEIEE